MLSMIWMPFFRRIYAFLFDYANFETKYLMQTIMIWSQYKYFIKFPESMTLMTIQVCHTPFQVQLADTIK